MGYCSCAWKVPVCSKWYSHLPLKSPCFFTEELKSSLTEVVRVKKKEEMTWASDILLPAASGNSKKASQTSSGILSQYIYFLPYAVIYVRSSLEQENVLPKTWPNLKILIFPPSCKAYRTCYHKKTVNLDEKIPKDLHLDEKIPTSPPFKHGKSSFFPLPSPPSQLHSTSLLWFLTSKTWDLLQEDFMISFLHL